MSESLTQPVSRSESLQHATDRFLDALQKWALRVIESHPDGFSSDSHDGGTFMQPWGTYVRATGDERPLDFMRAYRDEAKRHFEESEQWHHGYWRRQEVHHGTEHFDIFLRALWELDPGDQETVRQLEDVAEHIGNWVDEVPPWFDNQRGLFRSYHLGTEVVGDRCESNAPPHVRVLNLCLLADEMTGRDRYRDLAQSYGRLWARALTATDQLPAAVCEGAGTNGMGADMEVYQSFAGEAPDEFISELSRAENLIASAVPEAMLSLREVTGDEIFQAAAAAICDVVTEVLEDSVAWQAHAAVRRFRDRTGSDRYDDLVSQMPDRCFRPVTELTLIPEVDEPIATGPLGMRSDKPDWVEQDGNACPSPLLWALRAGVDDDEELMRRAVDIGLTHFRLAKEAFGDVTHHGCGSTSLCAVARGHGRLNGAGVVTEVLQPAIDFQTHQSG